MRLFLADFENRLANKFNAETVGGVNQSDSQLQLKNNVPMQSKRKQRAWRIDGTD